MKLLQTKIRRKAEGNILVMALLAATIMGTTLAAFLNLTNHQNLSLVRSYVWNSVIPYAEAGIEEALTHMNTMGDVSAWATNGWAYSNGNYVVTRTLGDASYTVTISSNSSPTITSVASVIMPVSGAVLSRTVRVSSANLGTGIRGLTAIGGVELVGNILLDSFDSTDPTKSLNGLYDISVQQDNGFVGSVQGSVTGGGGLVYGSAATGPLGSVSSAGTIGDAAWHAGGSSGVQPGHYANDLNISFPDATAPFTTGTGLLGTGGAATYTNLNITTLTNVSYTPPTNGFSITTNILTITTNSIPSPLPSSGLSTNTVPVSTTTASLPSPLPSGTITTNSAPQSAGPFPTMFAAQLAATASGMVGTPTYNEVTSGPPSLRGWYVEYNQITGYTYDVAATNYSYSVYEYSSLNLQTNSSTVTDNYTYILGDDDYVASSLSLSGHQNMLVTGTARLYISSGFFMTGLSEIIIAPGGSLMIYSDGNVDLAGNGVMNLNRNALKYQVIGLPSCTNIRMAGNAAFTGIIYAPSAQLQLGGGGSTIYDCVGAAMVGSAKLNGHFNFHYDEMLGNEDYGYEWLITGWSEI